MIAGVSGFKLAAMAGGNASRLAEIGAQYGVTALYADYRDVLADPAIDLVHIATRWDSHTEISIAAGRFDGVDEDRNGRPGIPQERRNCHSRLNLIRQNLDTELRS
ncbi:MAG: Gfo/Idh/MocA family oxidoreductase [Pseudomonadota bacterium]|nr:Gfo/Idh/MocA family oxidoreductase [Pseudomonadota bacterium]